MVAAETVVAEGQETLPHWPLLGRVFRQGSNKRSGQARGRVSGRAELWPFVFFQRLRSHGSLRCLSRRRRLRLFFTLSAFWTDDFFSDYRACTPLGFKQLLGQTNHIHRTITL